MRTALSMKPTGWFQFGWSSTVPESGVVPLRYFGQDLAAWRDHEGTVHLLDAYCQHLGANLAHGGCVVDSGTAVPVSRMDLGRRRPQRLHPLRGAAQPGAADPIVARRRAQRRPLSLARRPG